MGTEPWKDPSSDCKKWAASGQTQVRKDAPRDKAVWTAGTQEALGGCWGPVPSERTPGGGHWPLRPPHSLPTREGVGRGNLGP